MMLVLAGCGRGDVEAGDRRASVAVDHPVVPVAGRALGGFDELAIPTRLAAVGPYLVVLDAAADSVLHVVGIRSGEVVAQHGRRGAGPGEYAGAWSLDPDPINPGRVRVYDLSLRRLTELEVASGITGVTLHFRGSVQLQQGPTVTGPVMTAEGYALSLGFFARGRIGSYSSDGAWLGVRGPMPVGPEEAPFSVVQHAHQATLVPRPDRSQLAALARHGSRIELFSTDGTRTGTFYGPARFDPRITVGKGSRGFAVGGSDPYGYLDAAGSDDHIYGLFSGRTTNEFQRRAGYAQYVHVFDWDGNLTAVLDLQTDVVAIAVDPAGRTLFAIVHDPVPGVYEFPLPRNVAATPTSTD